MSPEPAPSASCVVGTAGAGQRLDRFLAAHLALPRNQVQQWIDAGRVTVRGAVAKASTRLESGDAVAWDPPPPPAADDRLEPEDAPLDVLWSDPHLLVIAKPAGLTVHPGAGRPTGTLAHRLLAHHPEMLGVGGAGRPGIVHRLDKDTSGAMVVARTAEAYLQLSRAFAARRVDKQYLAICHGTVGERRDVDAPIGRHPHRRQQMTVRSDGRPARSIVHPLATAAGCSLVAVDLLTGRTHQIRVHLKSIGHPLVGDPLYGEERWKAAPAALRVRLRDFPRPALHAWRLAFPHPVEDRQVRVEAPVPDDLRALWVGLGGGDLQQIAAASPPSSRATAAR